MFGRRERDVRRGFSLPPTIGPGTIVDGALHPGWTWSFVRSEPIRFASSAASLQRWFDVYAFRIGRPDSHRVAILIRDITGPKQTQDALNAARAELAMHAGQLQRRVSERTAELTAAP